MRHIALVAVSLALTTLFACVEDVGKDKVAATVAEVPAEAAPPSPVSAPTGTPIAVDPARSSLRALGAKITATHPIDFTRYHGTITVDGDTVTAVEFAVEMASLVADHPKLTTHLKSDDFFDIEAHPKATFASTAVVAGSPEADATHTITGDLTLRGATKRISFPATITVAPAAVTARAEFVLNRKDFGITYPGRPDDLIQDNVRMTIAFTAPRGA